MNTSGDLISPQERSWRRRRLDRDRSLGLRLTLAATATFLVLVPFALLALLVLDAWSPLSRLDASITDTLHGYALDHPAWVRLMGVWTHVFGPGPLRVAAAGAVVWLLLRGAPRLAIWVVTTMTVGGLLGALLKLLVGRHRPDLLDPVARAAGYSFPSGHALNATLAAGVLLLVFLPFARHSRPLRGALWTVAVLIAVVTGLSRIALGVHWTSDVVGGWLLGVAVVAATSAAFSTWRTRVGRRPARTAREGVEPELAEPGPGGRHAEYGTRRGKGRLMSDVAVQIARRILLPVALLFSVMVALGLLVTRVLAKTWPFTVEDTVNRELAAHRTAGWNDVSLVFSTLASTQLIVVVTVLVALVLRLVLHRWREPIFLCAAVSAQALIFLFTTMAIDRRRPAVEHMDSSPPTSSFPSGHTSAAMALYVGIAVLLALRARSTPAKVTWWTLLVLVPVGVALTRMYRGMHHPSDVAASFLNGGVCVAIMARAVLDRTLTWGRAKLPLGRSGDDVTPAGAAAG